MEKPKTQTQLYSDGLLCLSQLRMLFSRVEIAFDKQDPKHLMESMAYFDAKSTELIKELKLIKAKLRSILNKME